MTDITISYYSDELEIQNVQKIHVICIEGIKYQRPYSISWLRLGGEIENPQYLKVKNSKLLS